MRRFRCVSLSSSSSRTVATSIKDRLKSAVHHAVTIIRLNVHFWQSEQLSQILTATELDWWSNTITSNLWFDIGQTLCILFFNIQEVLLLLHKIIKVCIVVTDNVMGLFEGGECCFELNQCSRDIILLILSLEAIQLTDEDVR